ncbi:MAG: hypothetical protein OEV49_03365 [candidate division Zixibacteria bacterium]|nr:hypothetical protein [candidate division Zixibacteria bacterium]
MPNELEGMHDFLTQDDSGTCKKYHYNFERQAPRLYEDNQVDSVLDVIDYIRSECGPAGSLEVTRMLVLTDHGFFNDSLVGSSTIPNMLWYRSEQDYMAGWLWWSVLYGHNQPTDNTHDSFISFRSDLAEKISLKPEASVTEQSLGQFYAGEFDSAFANIQADGMQGTALRKEYDDFVVQTKKRFPGRGHFGIVLGSWRPQGKNSILGYHPVIGLQMGGEGHRWRSDLVLNYRFLSAKNKYQVDSLGHIVETDRFGSWLVGLDLGLKFIDHGRFSTDCFVGVGYNAIRSVKKAGDPETVKVHSSFAASAGLRQRVFLSRRTGWYLGAQIRHNFVDYSNAGGTDLSGHTITISVVTGWSLNATLNQFLSKLNYKGSWRK